ncbi:hypothetical protein BDY21DRAFT_363763 [Lineolata rhizophorae]|uniref:Rhodopsin domain-containing protein n=1 Tax=Lineolata rhizophorae TaxID=578093 RepID=A0A6A6P153_9PEZI|nr:hypothetical protein BDY21DRAFT_363763 [Lineolata rhizophorae]
MLGSLSVLSDLYALLLLAALLWRLQMPLKQKIGLFSIFSCGFLVVMAGIIRTVMLYRLAAFSNADATWLGFNLFCCSHAECQLAMICASAPALKVFICRYGGDLAECCGKYVTSLSNRTRHIYHGRGNIAESFNNSLSSVKGSLRSVKGSVRSDRWMLRRKDETPDCERTQEMTVSMSLSKQQEEALQSWRPSRFGPDPNQDYSGTAEMYDTNNRGGNGPPVPPKDEDDFMSNPSSGAGMKEVRIRAMV